jgi:hypothetical protein
MAGAYQTVNGANHFLLYLIGQANQLDNSISSVVYVMDTDASTTTVGCVGSVVWNTLISSPTLMLYKGLAFAPVDPSIPTPTTTGSPLPTSSRTYTTTGTPALPSVSTGASAYPSPSYTSSATAPPSISPSSVPTISQAQLVDIDYLAVLQLGSAAATAIPSDYTARPVFLVFLNAATGQPVSAIAMPVISLGNQYACTLTGYSLAREGFTQLSADGRVLTFGCYNAPLGTNTFTSSAQRVIARVFANGEIPASSN